MLNNLPVLTRLAQSNKESDLLPPQNTQENYLYIYIFIYVFIDLFMCVCVWVFRLLTDSSLNQLHINVYIYRTYIMTAYTGVGQIKLSISF